MKNNMDKIVIKGARQHNLKNINIEILSDKINKIISMNPYKICLADTTGLATPDSIKKCLKIVIPLIKDIPLVMHFHQTNKSWQDNIITNDDCILFIKPKYCISHDSIHVFSTS